jgi:hypothetical protein
MPDGGIGWPRDCVTSARLSSAATHQRVRTTGSVARVGIHRRQTLATVGSLQPCQIVAAVITGRRAFG